MPTTNTLRLLQSLLIILQVINAGLATMHVSPSVALVLGAVLGGLQFYVHSTVGSDVVVMNKRELGVDDAR
jgi:hypothetical protein